MVRDQECQGALAEKRTLWGGGAPQVCDLRLLEDGGERGGAQVSNPVASETASKGGGERVGMSTGADAKANTRGDGLIERGWRTQVIAAWSCPSGPRRERLLRQGRVCSSRDCEHACGDGERAGVSAGADTQARV